MRQCASGEVVVAHDVSLARVTAGADRRLVHAVSFRDLPRAGGEKIPTLAEALELCRGRIVNVEVKADAPARLALVRAVARELARRGADTEIVLSSFDPRIVLALAAAAPRVPRGILVGRETPGPVVGLPFALRAAVTAAHVEGSLLSRRTIALLRRLGVRICAWTVNDAERAAELVGAGVGWVITDQPGSVALRIHGPRPR